MARVRDRSIDRDLAANHPNPVRILEVGTMSSQSHHTDIANSTGGALALQRQSKMLGDAYLIQCFPVTVTII